MDHKVNDKAWSWNIHQKYDVVRQEVDEFVSMGTTKYVENQVQTLGETVKGFCSNVFQDFIPSALANPGNHNAGTVQQKGKSMTETYKKSVTNLREKYLDADTKLLPSALSNPVNYDADSVPQNEMHATQNYNKPLNIIKEKHADNASERISTKQDSVHHVPPYYRLNNVKQTMPMATEGDKKITKALFPLAREGYIGSDFEGLVAKEISSSEDSNFIRINDETSLVVVTEDDYHNHEITDKAVSDFKGLVAKEKFSYEDSISIGINDETSLVVVTEDDYHNHEITDKAVSTAEDDSVRVCSSVNERTCDTFFDDCHCKILGIPQSSDVECFLSCGYLVEPTLFSSTSSLSNNSYYQSEFYTIPHETENFADDHTDSVSSASETPGHVDESKNDISDPKMKSIDLFEKTKLNESGVIVDIKLLDATSCRPRRHRSYKQMIKDAYTKTKRITKEYELLGILYGDIDKEPVQPEKHSRLPSISERTPGNEQLTEDSGDCDWELL